MNLDALTEDALSARSEAANEPSWLLERRLAAFKRWLDQDWPDSRLDEFWRSTPFATRFRVDRPVAAGEHPATSPASIADELGDVSVARIVDGTVVDCTVSEAAAAAGVVVSELVAAATTHAELVERHLGASTTSSQDSTGADEDRTVTVNDAAWSGGVFVHVPAEVELDEPIVVHVHASTADAHLPRVLVVIDHHARARIVLDHTSEGDVDAFVDEVAEFDVGDSAELELASLQNWGEEVQHLALHKVTARRDATVRTIAVTTGGKTVRLRPEVDLVGPGAEARPLGVYFADDGQWFDLQPYVRHIAPNATSDVLFKGALQGHSRTVFRGNVFVHRDAVGTATDENNRSLILTEGARADATPFLEIECADITAGHGSATGQIDALHLFYLESRGIRRYDALRLIVFGFFREVLDEVGIPGISDASMRAIESRVEAADLSAVQINDAALRDLTAPVEA